MRSVVPSIGVNIGALTVKVVSLDGDRVHWRVIAHQGRPEKGRL